MFGGRGRKNTISVISRPKALHMCQVGQTTVVLSHTEKVVEKYIINNYKV